MPSAEVTEAPTPETSSSSSAHQESRRASSPRVSDAEPHHPPVLSTADRRPSAAGGGGTFVQSSARLPSQQADHPAGGVSQGSGGTGAGPIGSAGYIDPASEPGEGRRSVLASYPVGGVMIREEASTAGEAPVQRIALTRGSSLTSVATLSQEQPDWLRSLSHLEPAVSLFNCSYVNYFRHENFRLMVITNFQINLICVNQLMFNFVAHFCRPLSTLFVRRPVLRCSSAVADALAAGWLPTQVPPQGNALGI